MSATEELKPCPFCGRTPDVLERASAVDEAGFFCAVSCKGGSYAAHAHHWAFGTTEDAARAAAIAAWNRRK